MTEKEWLDCTDPEVMLRFLRGKASNRKLRLFTVACARLVRESIPLSEWREAVNTAERFADGLASLEELHASNPYRYFMPSASAEDGRVRDQITADRTTAQLFGLYRCTVFGDPAFSQLYATHAWAEGRSLTGEQQPTLLREIFGPLPVRSVVPSASCLTSTVGALARTIYTERTFDRLPILADALEEAGCANADILAHCRQPGAHVRGCWVVDLVLGKE